MKDIITLVGFASSGKSATAEELIRKGYTSLAFADSLKDCLSAIFGWDREALAGHSDESRAWREAVDPWWADRLGIPEFSPRWAMRNYGTDVMRKHFHPEVWIASLERKITALGDRPIVITDARFYNELSMARALGARTFRIRRGPDPVWMSLALSANLGCVSSQAILQDQYAIHESEYGWIGAPIDLIIENDGDLADLHAKVRAHV